MFVGVVFVCWGLKCVISRVEQLFSDVLTNRSFVQVVCWVGLRFGYF